LYFIPWVYISADINWLLSAVRAEQFKYFSTAAVPLLNPLFVSVAPEQTHQYVSVCFIALSRWRYLIGLFCLTCNQLN
jgi:hypothetical protein